MVNLSSYHLFRSLIIVSLISCIGYFTYRYLNHTPHPTTAPIAISVQITTPQLESIEHQVYVTGSVSAQNETVIKANLEQASEVTQILVKLGQNVKPQQLLAILDTRRADLAVKLAQAKLTEAKAIFTKDKQKLAQDQNLQQAGAISDNEFLEDQTAVVADHARLEQAQLELTMRQLNRAEHYIRAPYAGVISKSMLKLHQQVNLGSELFTLTSPQLSWMVEVNQSDLKLVHPGQLSQLQLDANLTINGKVVQVSNSITNTNGTGSAIIELQAAPVAAKAVSAQTEIIEGMQAGGTINVGQQQQLVVPLAAITSRNGYNYVVEVDNNNLARLVRVELGPQSGSKIAIRKNTLALTAKIVVVGSNLLAQGDKVLIKAGR